MISIKDYARDNGISYEAVRAQVARYKDKLEPHIHKQGRKQFLDDNAVAFLDQHRAQSPVSVYNADAVREITTLREQNNQLLMKIAELADWKAEKALEIASVQQLQLAAENAQKMLAEKTSEVETVRKEAVEATERAETAEGRVNTLEDEKNALEGEIERLRAEAEQKAAEAAARAREEAERQFENRSFSEKLKDLFRKKGKYK